MQRQRDQLQHHALGRAGPADLALEAGIEEIVDALDLDRADVLAIGEIDAADGARHGHPFALGVLDDDLLRDVGEVRHRVDGDRNQPILLDHAAERAFPAGDVVVFGLRPGRLDLRQDGARAALMQDPVDLHLVLLRLDLLHGVDDVAAPFDGGDRRGGRCPPTCASAPPSIVTAPAAAAPLSACLRVRLSMLASLSSFFAIDAGVLGLCRTERRARNSGRVKLSSIAGDVILRATPARSAFGLGLVQGHGGANEVFNASPSIFSSSWKSMARLVLPSRLELKRREGSFRAAPLAKVIFTTFL